MMLSMNCAGLDEQIVDAARLLRHALDIAGDGSADIQRSLLDGSPFALIPNLTGFYIQQDKRWRSIIVEYGPSSSWHGVLL
jgi:hypothetical protein